MPRELLLGLAMVASLVLYVLGAGADFGGGVWDLFATGPRKADQRRLIEKAIGPIWEANHVWLILVVVLMFSAFPRAFAVISIRLHLPLTLLLLGIVFRGAAFVFRAYDVRDDVHQRRWGLMFSLASLVSPVLLGVVVGAVASGTLEASALTSTADYFSSWLAPFPLAVGLFALVLFAFLAATYLAAEADHSALEEDFRRRALWAGATVGALALVTFALSGEGAPRIRLGLTARPWTWPLHVATAVAALTAFVALLKRNYALARLAAAAQASLIVIGWAASQYPYLVVPGLTLENASANARTQAWLLGALGAGSLVLFPSLFVLLKVFKGRRAFAITRP